MKIAYVSCANLPEPDIDEKPLVEALINAGHDASVAAWDDDSVDWSSFDVTLIRATWNYALHLDAFRDWIKRVEKVTKLLNPQSTVEWNLNKEYLIELSDAGIPIIPTAFTSRYISLDIAQVSKDEGWSKIVIKPTVSAGSYATRSFDLSAGQINEAQAFFDEMIEQREMMIQEYIPSVDTIGETALIVIDGQLTHAIEKRPRFDDQEEEVYLRDEISDDMRAFAQRVLEAADQKHLYARVDVMPAADGSLMLSELEMLEPSLFFPYFLDATKVFIEGMEKTVASNSHS